MTLRYFIKQKLFAELLGHLNYGIFVLDDQMDYVYVNDKFSEIVKLPSDDIIGRPIGIIDPKKLSIETKILIEEVLNNLLLKKFHKGPVEFQPERNKKVKVDIKIYGMHVGGAIYYIGLVDESGSSMLSVKPTEVELQHFDPITQLPLKKYFMVQLSDLLRETDKNVLLVRLNLSRFSVLRTNYKDEIVNQILTGFIQRIYDSSIELSLNSLISFSRFGDDDFALVFETDDVDSVRADINNIMELNERPYIILDKSKDGTKPPRESSVYLHFCMGVSQYRLHGNHADVLVDNADKALNYAKEQGNDNVFWYDASMIQVSAEKLQLENDLRKALKNKEFFPVYQPKVDLATMDIIGFEALVRWNHPTRGIETPGYFLKGILENNLNFDLFCFMAEQVIKHLYIWQLRGMKQTLCLNADSYDFLHPNFLPFMTSMLEKYPVKKGTLHVEVTETSLMQHYDVDVRSQFEKLKEMGVLIALDDFGTGYASISYLRHYQFDYIKIDKSFIEDLETDNTQLLIVRAIIDLASALNLFTVAEGIETLAHSQIMHDMGCLHGQGYLYGRPMSYTEATDLVTNGNGKINIRHAKNSSSQKNRLRKAKANTKVSLSAKIMSESKASQKPQANAEVDSLTGKEAESVNQKQDLTHKPEEVKSTKSMADVSAVNKSANSTEPSNTRLSNIEVSVKKGSPSKFSESDSKNSVEIQNDTSDDAKTYESDSHESELNNEVKTIDKENQENVSSSNKTKEDTSEDNGSIDNDITTKTTTKLTKYFQSNTNFHSSLSSENKKEVDDSRQDEASGSSDGLDEDS